MLTQERIRPVQAQAADGNARSQGQAVVEARDLGKTYGAKVAVDV